MNNYEQYGQLMIQKEILDNRIMEVKQKIAKEMNKEGSEKKQKGAVEVKDGQATPTDTRSKKS